MGDIESIFDDEDDDSPESGLDLPDTAIWKNSRALLRKMGKVLGDGTVHLQSTVGVSVKVDAKDERVASCTVSFPCMTLANNHATITALTSLPDDLGGNLQVITLAMSDEFTQCSNQYRDKVQSALFKIKRGWEDQGITVHISLY